MITHTPSYYLTPEAEAERQRKLVERIADAAYAAGKVMPDSDYWRLPVRLQLDVAIALQWRKQQSRLVSSMASVQELADDLGWEA